jgi:hypothetical protein
LPVVILDSYRFECLGHSNHQQFQVAVVTAIVLDHRRAHPPQITFVRGLVRLLCP